MKDGNQPLQAHTVDSLSYMSSSGKNTIEVWVIELNTKKIMTSYRFYREQNEFSKFETIEPYSKFPIPLDIVAY